MPSRYRARSCLIVPVESQVRELDAKILLACVAAERGFPVILGSRAILHHRMASFPTGIYLAKSMKSLSRTMFRIIRQLGHEIVAFDEEGLVRFDDEHYYETRLDAETLGRVSRLFAWGNDDARAFRAFDGFPGLPIHVTGNPRIDLLRSELRPYFGARCRELQERFGDFVLVNTNFGGLNHFLPKLGELRRALEMAPKKESDFLAGRAAHRARIFEAMRQLVPAIASALPDHQVVVRPHPSESHAPWLEAADDHHGVHVINEGNVIPWLMACQALVHNGCTTAVEAAVLGKPAFAYQPVTSERFDLELPNSLSRACPNAEILVSELLAAANGDPRDWEQQRSAILRQHVSALDGPLASDRMVDVLSELGDLERTPATASPLAYARARIHVAARTAIKRLNMRRSQHRNAQGYHDHRFPGISLDGLRERIARLHVPLGRFKELRATQLAEHVFRIES